MADLYAKIDMTYNPGIVVNTQIVNSVTDILDPNFTWVDIANINPQPHIGWAYNGQTFTNVNCSPYITAIPASVPSGSATTIESFNLSSGSGSFLVTLNGRILSVGCQYYDYIWLRYALYEISQGLTNIGILSQTSTGIAQSNTFNILQTDINAIYTALSTLVPADPTIFPSFTNAPNMTEQQMAEEQIEEAATFGQGLITQFAAANALAGITKAGQTQAVIDYTANLSQCLWTGSLYAAVDAMNIMIQDNSATKTNLAPFITNVIITSYLNQVQTYLGIPLT